MNILLRAAALAVALGACGAVGAASASSVVFFDDFDDDAIMRGDKPGMELINWRVTDGYVDVIGSSHGKTWAETWSGHGAYVDLNGTGNLAGRIETKKTFDLVLGGVYEFSFDYAKSHQEGETILFGIGGTTGSLVLPAGPKHNFVHFSIVFEATDTLATIFLAGVGAGNIGAKVDNVRLFGPIVPAFASGPVVATPLPPGLALLATALAGLGLFRRRRA